jgi:spore coat protein U-like protein
VNRFLVLLLLALALPPASAGTLCRLVGGTTVAFGTYDYFDAQPNDSQANVTIRCERDGGPGTLTVAMRIDRGLFGSGVGARRMVETSGSGHLMRYGLYRDVARTQVWGVTEPVDTMSATLAIPNKSSASATFTIYGRIPPHQDLAAGRYADRVQVTILY